MECVDRMITSLLSLAVENAHFFGKGSSCLPVDGDQARQLVEQYIDLCMKTRNEFLVENIINRLLLNDADRIGKLVWKSFAAQMLLYFYNLVTSWSSPSTPPPALNGFYSVVATCLFDRQGRNVNITEDQFVVAFIVAVNSGGVDFLKQTYVPNLIAYPSFEPDICSCLLVFYAGSSRSVGTQATISNSSAISKREKQNFLLPKPHPSRLSLRHSSNQWRNLSLPQPSHSRAS